MQSVFVHITGFRGYGIRVGCMEPGGPDTCIGLGESLLVISVFSALAAADLTRVLLLILHFLFVTSIASFASTPLAPLLPVQTGIWHSDLHVQDHTQRTHLRPSLNHSQRAGFLRG